MSECLIRQGKLLNAFNRAAVAWIHGTDNVKNLHS